MLATYGSALIVVGASLLAGQAILLACGWRRWSWLSPAVGLGAITALAWWTVRLPGEGTTALAAIAVVAAACLVALRGRVDGVGEAVRAGGLVAALALLATSIPFLVEGRFGILGTGFNVDMSEHLFTADWLAAPAGDEPGKVRQGYPLGPHALDVAAAEAAGGSLVPAFSGVTIAVPVLAALTSLGALVGLAPLRRSLGAVLVALPYLIASYLAQGQFKELFQALFVLALALALHRLARGEPEGGGPRARLLRGLPLGVLGAGAVYAYSGPGLVWLVGIGAAWAAVELLRARLAGSSPGALLRAGAGPAAIAVLALVVFAAPEAGRVVDFGSNATELADAGDGEQDQQGVALVDDRGDRPGNRGGAADAAADTGEPAVAPPRRPEERGELFNDDLGNLFGDISPLEALGVWPSGDFRVQAGDGAAPAVAFYAGALLAAVALLAGLLRWWRRGETAVPVAFGVSVAIYLAALALSTPYTTAKALQMVAPLAMLIPVRELLGKEFLPRIGSLGRMAAVARRAPARVALALAFTAAAGLSTLLALGNAPVGPESYTPNLAKLRPRIASEPTLALAAPELLAEKQGRAYLAWELRGARPLCIEPAIAAEGLDPPPGVRFVVSPGDAEPPFAGLREEERRGETVLWEVIEPRSASIGSEPGEPTVCSFEAQG